MFQYGKQFAKELSDCIRMYMFVACGVAENKFKQPQFDESSTEDSIYYKLVSMIDDSSFIYDEKKERYLIRDYENEKYISLDEIKREIMGP